VTLAGFQPPAETNGITRSSPSVRQFKAIVTAVAIVVCGALLLADLGHYALWDDEANTALIGEGVWRTGDTSAVVGQNLVAYRGGVELTHLKERYLPPLQYYVAAPFVGIWPGNAWAARLPFAGVGLASVLLIFWWVWLEEIKPLTLLLLAMALVGNVSFWLYLRQCRYYSLSVFFSLSIAFCYLSRSPKPRTLWLISLLSIGLLASNYMNYAALYGILIVDWLIWNRHRFAIGVRGVLCLVVPQVVVGALILWTWNPLHKNVFGSTEVSFVDRIRLFWWAWRDLNRCEFAALLLLAAGPIVGYWRGDRRLLRAATALFCYVAIIVLITPQNPALPMNAVLQPIRIFDVRYLAPAIPLMIAVGVLTIADLFRGRNWWPALLLGALAFGTNILQGGRLVGNDALDRPAPLFHSAPLLYAGELMNPPADPYRLAANWINEHVLPGQTVWVLPDYMTYPLMLHAPRAVYAWQLPHDPAAELRGLNPAMYKGRVVPDYLICFGPDALRTVDGARFLTPTHARNVDTIHFFWHDLYRPELAWRMFGPVTEYQAGLEEIQIFRMRSPISGHGE
jgi:hypothetical protein